MVNRIIIALASILSSGILAYAHLVLYWEIHSGKVRPTEGIAHIHASLPILKDGALLTFGLLFFTLFCASLIFTIKGRLKFLFACFVCVMVLIWVRIWAGGTN
jgi:hypothetical protein